MGHGIYCDVCECVDCGCPIHPHDQSIEVPDKVHDLIPVVSVSGGKDSTAVCLALTEAGIEHRRVFADTGWEHDSTYEHLDTLRKHLGPIDVVGVEGGMVAKMRVRAGFPSRMQRWCTSTLKIKPLQEYHDEIRDSEGDTVSVVGIRSDESHSRSMMLPFEDDDRWGGYVWRPILSWSVEDVISIHHRHGVPLHPLYHQGMSRVGCWPCIFARKDEIRLMAEIDPGRIDLIRSLEQEFVQLRRSRNEETPGRYANPDDACFFMSIDRRVKNNIDQVVAWSRTSRGGKQVELLAPPPSGGCFRWGMCEPPEKE